MSALRDREDDADEVAVAVETTDVLTNLLIGMTKSEVHDLRSAVHSDEEFVERVGSVLGEALERADADPRLRSSLGAVTERSVLEIARLKPAKLGDAIAPAMGPAIRGMVTLAMADLNERVESIIQQSFSLQGLKWRVEALRSGTPLSELVLRDTLTYRVEHALLIHRSSGTLLNHAMQPEYQGKDPAVVAAMLTAVKQFLEEAFEPVESVSDDSAELRANENPEELSHQFSAGDSSIIIRAAGELALAVVVRGTQTARLQQLVSASLQKLLEAYGRQALAFDGNVERYSGAHSLLENCLHTEQARVKNQESGSRFLPKLKRYAPAILAGLAIAGWLSYQSFIEQKNWQSFVLALKQQPGIVVANATKNDSQSATIAGLRDPDSTDVSVLAIKFGYTDVSWEMQRYLSLEPAVMLARARRILQPPAGVHLRFGDGTLRVTGRASDEWLSSIERLSVPGAAEIDLRQILPPELP